MGKLENFGKSALEVGRKIHGGAKDAVERARMLGRDVAQSETFINASEVVGKWKDQKVEDFKDWKDQAKDSLKIQTVEKWRMLTDRGLDNCLINLKDQDIKKVESEMKGVEAEIAGLKKEEGTIEASVDKINNPEMKRLLEQKTSDMKAKLKERLEYLEQTQMQELRDRKDKYLEEKESLNGKVNNLEENFSGRIDGKIEDIKNRYGLQEKIEDSKRLGEDIGNLRTSIKDSEKSLAEDTKTFSELRKHLTGSDLKDLDDMLKKAGNELRENKRELFRKETAKNKLDQQVETINRKTGKWEKMKDKYGLGNKNEAASSTARPQENPSGNLWNGVSEDEYVDADMETMKKIEDLCLYRNSSKLQGNFNEIQQSVKQLDVNNPVRKLVEKMGTPKDMKASMLKIRNFVRTVKEAYE